MKLFRFNNIKRKKRYSLYAAITSLAAVSIILNLGTTIEKPLLFLLMSITSAVATMMLIKESSTGVEELVMDGDTIKIIFFNKTKKEHIAQKESLAYQIDEDKIIFKELSKDKNIAISRKD